MGEFHSAVFPIQCRWSKKIYKESVVGMIIYCLGIFGMAFEAAAHTAPERFLRCAVNLVGAAEQGHEIANHAALGVLLPENMVEECALIPVGHRRIGVPAKHMAGEFEHIVGAARLAGIAVDKSGHVIGVEVMLFLAQRAGGEAGRSSRARNAR